LTGYWQDYDAVVQTADLAQQKLAGGEFAVSRNINPFLTGTATVDYTNQHIVGGDLSWATLAVVLNYQLSQAMAVYFRTSYARQLTDSALSAVSPGTSGFSDLAITIGVRRQF
jgi:predicted porin